MKHLITLLLILAFLAASGWQPAAAQEPQNVLTNSFIERITAGKQGFGGGEYASISASGQYVVFESMASDLSAGHLEESMDVYVYDRYASMLERASTRSDGQPVYNPFIYTSPPKISGNGQFVAFMSNAETLVSNDGNAMPDVFVHDRQTGITELVSVNMGGQAGNDYSSTPAISADGRYVVFQSWADNLVKNDTNESVDIFIRDRQENTTEIVSVGDAEQQGTDWHDYGFSSVSVSDNGRFVAFSYESLPVAGRPLGSEPGVYLRDRQSATTRFIAGGEFPVLSSTGRHLAFVTSVALVSDDRNGTSDVYVYDQATNQFTRVSVSSDNREVRDQWMFSAPDISADGNFVVFESDAAGLAPGDTNNTSDIFLRDIKAETTTLISQANGQAGNSESHHPVIADNASAIAFTSSASDLVPGDTNEIVDVFVFNRAVLYTTPQQFFLPAMFRTSR